MPKRTHDGLKKRCGCSPRAWPKCSHPWHFSLHHGGREYRYSLDVVARSRNEDPPTTKTDAIKWRDILRSEIRAGTFVDPDAPKPTPPATPLSDTRLTFADVEAEYEKNHIEVPGRRKAGADIMKWQMKRLLAAEVPGPNGTSVRLGTKRLDEITTPDVEAVRRGWALHLKASKGGRTGPERALKRLRHFFTWAIEHEYTDRTPFRRNGVVVVHFGKEGGRTRRLEPGEEERLKQHAPAYLRALIVAALETGCRKGELLDLQWRDVKWQQNALLLPAEKTKTAEDRDVPMTTDLTALIETRRYAPDGTEHEPDDYVFGNEVGEKTRDIREAWEQTCRAAKIEDLHFHDLRREFASRLKESGAPEHEVAAWLGHANISTTSRYLKTTSVGLQRRLSRFEEYQKRRAEEEREFLKRRAAEKGDNRRIRTPFAHGPAEDTSSDSQESTRKSA